MPDSWHRHHAPPPIAGAVDIHLDDQSLINPVSPEHHKHLADCLYCTQRAAQVREAHDRAAEDVADFDAFEQALIFRLHDQELPPAFAAARLPSAVASVVQAAPARPDVAPSQLWRLSWEAVTMLAVVVSTDATSAVVAPVTPDTDLASEYTLVVPGSGNHLDGPWATWLPLTRPVPLFVFDRYYTSLTLPAAGRSFAQVARDVIAAYRTGSHAHDAPVGDTPQQEPGVLALTDCLREQLAVFADAEPDAPARPTVTADDLGIAIDAVSPDQLRQAGLRRGDLLEVVRGAEQLNEEQAAAWAPVLGLDVEQLLEIDSGPPDGLIVEASRVEWRPAREMWALEAHVELASAPYELAKSAYALAGRTNSAAAGTRWRAMVQYALHEQLAKLASQT